MKKLIRYILVTILILIMFTFLTISANATTRFEDVDSSYWAEDEICFCYYHGAFYTTLNKFYPYGGLRRDVAIDGIRRMLDVPGIPKYSSTPFSDVPSTNENSGSIKWAYDNNITQGTGNGLFSPNTIISKQEFATLVYRACGVVGTNLPNTNSVSFSDDSSIASWARTSVYELAEAGIIMGYPNGSFGPTDTIDRGSGASMLSRLYAINKYPGDEIIFYIRNKNGAPIPNASVYVYYENKTDNSKYPETKIKSNDYGIAVLSSTNNDTICANVFAQYFSQTITDTKFYRNNFINTIEMKQYNAIKFTVPISGFNNITEWANTRNYLDRCQNYGWRYDQNSDSNYHQGIDIARPTGTSVFSSSSGTVYLAGYSTVYGTYVQIEYCRPKDSNNNSDLKYYFIYQHLNSRYVSTGAGVVQNEIIGTVGSSGASSGPHLHYSISTSSLMDDENRYFLDPIDMLQNQNQFYDYYDDGSERW